jgi:UPF0271 protein
VAEVDLNADVGERDEPDGRDDALLDVVTSASVACGGHAGSPAVMAELARGAAGRGVALGAHPSYPDREGFGRRPMRLEGRELARVVGAQVEELLAVAAGVGCRVRYVKPHGALYHAAAEDADVARTLARAVRRLGDLVLLLPAGSRSAPSLGRAGVVVAAEGFADRGYLPDGRLVPRGEPGAVHAEPAAVAAQALSLATRGGVVAVDGSWVPLAVDSICVHGDTPGALTLARAARAALEAAGVTLRPFAAE